MIVIDYIQLMRADSHASSRYEQISEISRELKLLAQDLGIPVLAMTQFNRESAKMAQRLRWIKPKTLVVLSRMPMCL